MITSQCCRPQSALIEDNQHVQLGPWRAEFPIRKHIGGIHAASSLFARSTRSLSLTSDGEIYLATLQYPSWSRSN